MRLKDDHLTHFGRILAAAVDADKSNPSSDRRLGNQINELSLNLVSYLIAQAENKSLCINIVRQPRMRQQKEKLAPKPQ